MAANLQRSKRSGAKLVLCTFSTICTADNQPPRPQCWSQRTTYASVWEFQTCRYTSPCASKITIEVQSTPSKMSHVCFSSFRGFPIYLEVTVEKALNQFSCDFGKSHHLLLWHCSEQKCKENPVFHLGCVCMFWLHPRYKGRLLTLALYTPCWNMGDSILCKIFLFKSQSEKRRVAKARKCCGPTRFQNTRCGLGKYSKAIT